MKTNTKATTRVENAAGGPGRKQTPLEELTRAVSTCLLWEDTFYSKGSEIAKRIEDLCTQVYAHELEALALRARNDLKLRHVPLFLCVQLAKRQFTFYGPTLASVIQRPDEITEFLSLYWRDGKKPLAAQVKKGLAKAFTKFSEYQLAKWNKDGAIKLRDALFLCHAKPLTPEMDSLWKKLISNTLPPPDTWEVALSSGANKKATWERLLRENQLGYMALLMNLRNMCEAQVDPTLVRTAIHLGAAKSKALPFRFLSAAKHAPQYADSLNDAMMKSIYHMSKLEGETAIIIDVSGSMDVPISSKSELLRWEAAAAIAVLGRELTPACRVFTFSNALHEIINIRGMGLVREIGASQPHGATYLSQALTMVKQTMPKVNRIIVLTDEQSQDGIIPPWCEKAYIINVASEKHGLDRHSGWNRIYGFSERLFDWIAQEEACELSQEVPQGPSNES